MNHRPPSPASRALGLHDPLGGRTWRDMGWRTLGSLSLAVGLINAFLPLLPTTVFLLIGVWAFGRSSPVIRDRLLNHPRFGHALRLWVEHRQIQRQGKWAACLGIAASGALSAALIGPRPLSGLLLAGLGLLCVYLATRPEPPASPAA